MEKDFPMLHKLLILVTCISGIMGVQAQNFKPGYYVNLDADTLFGQVAVKDLRSHEKTCMFKRSKKDKIHKWTPDEILGYGFLEGGVFRQKLVQEKSDIVFMELLLEGKISLYRYQGRFFLEYEGGKKFKELYSTEEIHQEGYRLRTEKSHEYLSVLSEAMIDHPGVLHPYSSGKVKILLTRKPLVKLIKEYHKRSRISVFEPEPEGRWRLYWGVQAGGGIATLSYLPDDVYQQPNELSANRIHSLVNAEYDPSISPAFGMTLTIAGPDTKPNLAFQAELLYHPFTAKASYSFLIPDVPGLDGDQQISDEIIIRMQKLMIPLGVRKKLGKGLRAPYIMLGLSPQINMRNKIEISRRYDPPARNRNLPFESIYIDGRNEFELAVWSKLGCILTSTSENRLSLEIRGDFVSRKHFDWRSSELTGLPIQGDNRYRSLSAFAMLNYGF